MFVDEITRQRIVTAKHAGDITYDAFSDDTTVDNEDIPIIGNWEDWTGSGTVDSRIQQMSQVPNELYGEDAQIDCGAKVVDLTERGVTAQTHRQRRRKVYVDLSKNGKSV